MPGQYTRPERDEHAQAGQRRERPDHQPAGEPDRPRRYEGDGRYAASATSEWSPSTAAQSANCRATPAADMAARVP